jgi:hypothetical protein
VILRFIQSLMSARRDVVGHRIGCLRVAVALVLPLLAGMAVSVSPPLVQAGEVAAQPFEKLAGRWVGKGRIGFKSGAVEEIKCRATYFVEGEGNALRQNLRCASPGGKVELKNKLSHSAGKLSGEWQELIYNLKGSISGDVTPKGYRVRATGDGLAASMDIIVKDVRQIVEVHFDSETLIGMTLLLTKG